jgi:hypothetical protein
MNNDFRCKYTTISSAVIYYYIYLEINCTYTTVLLRYEFGLVYDERREREGRNRLGQIDISYKNTFSTKIA